MSILLGHFKSYWQRSYLLVGSHYHDIPGGKLRSFHAFEATTLVSLNKHSCNLDTHTAQGRSKYTSYHEGKNKDNSSKVWNVREALDFP